MRIYIVIVATLWFSGCASVIPDAIRTAAPGDIMIAQVREQPQQYRDAVVRWGGNIVSIRNEREQSILEVIGRELDNNGRPREQDFNLGRFLVKVQGFLDPAIYKPERAVTVRGRIQAVVEQAIGEYRYRYPVVLTDDIHLWQPRLPPEPYYRVHDPYFFDPWYPWGPAYPRPWPYYYP